MLTLTAQGELERENYENKVQTADKMRMLHATAYALFIETVDLGSDGLET